MGHFIQTLFGGLSDGAVYGSLAIALVIVFRASGHVNIAQGEMAMLSVLFTWYLSSGPNGPGLNIWLAIVVAIVVSVAIGALLQRFVIRYVDPESALAYLILTVALLMTFNSAGILAFGTDPEKMAPMFRNTVYDVAGARLALTTVGMLAVLILVSILLSVLLTRTKLGLALRAVASNPESSQLSGIPHQRMMMVSWGLAAGVGALAGALITNAVYVEPNMMLGVLIYAFAAVILGGVDSVVGAVVGGLIIGIVESLTATYVDAIGPGLKILVPFVLILVLLLLRPSGLFGTSKVRRA